MPVTVSSAAAILYFASLKTEIGEKISALQKTEQFVHSIISGGHFPQGALLRCACRRGLVLHRCAADVCHMSPVRRGQFTALRFRRGGASVAEECTRLTPQIVSKKVCASPPLASLTRLARGRRERRFHWSQRDMP